MISILKSKGLEIILAGMLAPPNMGKVYGDEFNAIYPQLAEKHADYALPVFSRWCRSGAEPKPCRWYPSQ